MVVVRARAGGTEWQSHGAHGLTGGPTDTVTGRAAIHERVAHRCEVRQLVQKPATPAEGARHIAGALAAIALVVPEPADDRTRIVDQYDLCQATYAILLAAALLGIGTGHSSVGDHPPPGPFWASPKATSRPFSSASGTRPTGRSAPSPNPTGDI